MNEQGLTYKDAGVDTKEGERAVSLMKDHAADKLYVIMPHA